MSDLPPVRAIVSNPGTQLGNADTSTINMSTNDTLPASVLEAPSDNPNPDTLGTTSTIPQQHILQPAISASAMTTEQLPHPQEFQHTDIPEAAPTPSLTNGDHTTHIPPPLTTPSASTFPPISPTTATPPKPPAHSPAPTRGSTPAPSSSLNNMGPSHIINSANGETGSPTRAYMNTKVTPSLLEGMKWVARNEPEKPLKWLGEYLLARSREIEGS